MLAGRLFRHMDIPSQIMGYVFLRVQVSAYSSTGQMAV
jgi:hypothetical protein